MTTMRMICRFQSALLRTLVTYSVLGLSVLLSACAGLPPDVARPPSQALAHSAGTALDALWRQHRASSGAPHASGFALLDGPQAAYGSRLALILEAQKTLDLQYYAIHADASSERLLLALRQAAARGVRVRILLDDFHSVGRNASVLHLAFVPNIEVRLFNPLAGNRSSTLLRVMRSLGDVKRIQQRMHNKLFIADNVMGITGGRNLGDAYFGLGDAGNFVDLDVLATGPIVREMSRSFDSYWNDQRAYPARALITREELAQLELQERQHPAQVDSDGLPQPPGVDPQTLASPATPTDAQRQSMAWDQKPMDLGAQPFEWAPSAVLADAPAKIPADEQAAAGPPPPKPPPARGQLPVGETVVGGLLHLIREAQRDLLIISPYFVPGDDMKQAFSEASRRGVRIRILTNSLASNDAPIAHVGYARHRKDLLNAGVTLYEMRSEQAGLGSALGSSGASRAMLHSKVLVRDGQLLVIGSMNLDLRSQLQNTEIALLIRSPALAQEATRLIERSMQDGAWRVEQTPEQALVWRAPANSGLRDARVEPDTSWGLRLLLRLVGPLAPDEML